jgi:hypothetical protein
LVQKTVATNTNFAGRLSEGMLRKSAADGKRKKWKSAMIFRMRDREKMNPNGERKK